MSRNMLTFLCLTLINTFVTYKNNYMIADNPIISLPVNEYTLRRPRNVCISLRINPHTATICIKYRCEKTENAKIT